jgi:uncharacterized damage-inducible protein DinB
MSVSGGLSADPLDILLMHDRWGTRRILEVCETLTREQFHQRFEIGPGSLHATLIHIIGAMRRWADRIAARELRPVIDTPPRHPDMPSQYRERTPREMIDLLDDAAADLVRIAADLRRSDGFGLASVMVVPFGQTEYTFTRGAALVHVTTHGMHHRAQCLNMLRQLGIEPSPDDLPEIAVIDWQAEVETKQLKPYARRNAAAPSQGPTS